MLKRILVVDNDLQILEMMEEALSYEGFKVDTCSGTDNILKLIAQIQPDLLIVDYILDGINGGEYCRQVKNNPATSSLPVIMFSAYSKVLFSLGNYGSDAFLAKPFDLRELISKVNQLLHPKSLNQVLIAS